MLNGCQGPSTMGVFAAKWAIFRDIDRIDCNRRRFESDRDPRVFLGPKARIYRVFAVTGTVSGPLFRVEVALVFERNGRRLESTERPGYVPLTCGFAVGEHVWGVLFRTNSLKTH